MTTEIRYIAFDGTVFTDKTECENYEDNIMQETFGRLKFIEKDFDDILSDSIGYLSSGDKYLVVYIDSENKKEDLLKWLHSFKECCLIPEYLEIGQTYIVKTNSCLNEFYGIDDIEDVRRDFARELEYLETEAYIMSSCEGE